MIERDDRLRAIGQALLKLIREDAAGTLLYVGRSGNVANARLYARAWDFLTALTYGDIHGEVHV